MNLYSIFFDDRKQVEKEKKNLQRTEPKAGLPNEDIFYTFIVFGGD